MERKHNLPVNWKENIIYRRKERNNQSVRWTENSAGKICQRDGKNPQHTSKFDSWHSLPVGREENEVG